MRAWCRLLMCAACGTGVLLLAGAAVLLAGAAVARDGRTAAAAASGPVEQVATPPAIATADAKARTYFTDRPVITQHGQELRFYSDVLKDRIVVVTLFFAGCTGVCPVNNEKLAELQTLLGDAMGQDVFFVSVSVDPEHDTVEDLAQYAARFGAGKGWLFLTGDKDDIATITRRLGHTSADPEAHTAFFMLGNVARAHWAKVAPYEPAEAIFNRLKEMMVSSDGGQRLGDAATR
jgi:cytochrome oxidase Cu insertion factor (SCO1/SenC/PrrC family)